MENTEKNKQPGFMDWVKDNTFEIYMCITLLAAVITIFIVFPKLCDNCDRHRYCGTVKKRYITIEGSKSIGSEHRIVFYCDSTKRNINIEVTPNTYSNSAEGSRVCFILSQRQVE